MLEGTLNTTHRITITEPLTYKQICETVERAVEEALTVLKEIDPEIHKTKYEKGDETWVLKNRLILGMMMELIFMGKFNYDDLP